MFVHWRSLFRRTGFERDMESEFAFHLEARKRDLVLSGLSEEEAERRARMEFGAAPRYYDECREAYRLNWMDELIRNAKFGIRSLRRSPGFSLAAIISLALGIGVNTLVFSVLNSLLLRPLPITDSKQVVFVDSATGPGHSFPDYRELRDGNSTFRGMAGYRISNMSVDEGGNASRAWGYLATGNYFDVLGIKPALGRFFHQEDDRHVGGSPYAVLSYNTWQARFGGNRAIVGRTIRINGLPYTILGVAPRAFHGTEIFYWPEIWVPMTMEPQIEVGNPWLDNRNTWNTWIIGRLKPGVTVGHATADLSRIASDLARRFPDSDKGLRLNLSQPGLVGSTMRGPVEAFTLGVLVLATFVLLIACANLAAFMLARATDRQRETAIRISIGAGRGRLMLQALTESMLLATVGGAAGWGLALALDRLLSEWRAPLDFPVQFDISPDWAVFAFAAAISIATAVLFGLGPALKSSKANANSALKGGSNIPTFRRRHALAFRDILLAAQLALCFLLVFASVIAVRGLQNALSLPIGMNVQNVTTAAFDLGLAGYDEPRAKAFQQRVLESVKTIPGVRSAAYANSLPLSIDQSTTTVSGIDEAPAKGRYATQANYYDISPGLISTLGMPLLHGRDFDSHDTANAPRVAIVNETFARVVMRTNAPVGKMFRRGPGGPSIQVVGLVRDGKYQSLTEPPRPAVFWPIEQDYNPTTTIVVKSHLPPDEITQDVRKRIAELNSHLPVYGTGSLSTMLGFALFPMHAAALALGAFGTLAIVLAITGIYGLAAYAVAQRTRELAIRIALGATRQAILGLVTKKLALLVASGVTVGTVLALAAGPLLRSVVYGVSPSDFAALFTVMGFLVLAAALSCWRPAFRAMRTDAITTLRGD